MTKAEALRNVTDTLTAQRAALGAPRVIVLGCADGHQVFCSSGWSKSSINNGSQVVFLIIEETTYAKLIPNVKSITYGAAMFAVSGAIEPPKEPGGYWLLPVKEA